ncbi:NAD(P)-dependent oxidoreductase [Sphingosinicella terrae]|uniref:NAD(P)-dependent oxidoreductase n=1 Tax=Sphingosinicella terrae TaxID=2172047 RepID=UPI000E0CD708|nr:NAD(P)-dependent oxidoreductase [Sphingosinicella terrae]
MPDEANRISLIGFGEAGTAFAEGLARTVHVRAYDIKTTDPAAAPAMREAYRRLGIDGAATPAEALASADIVISVVTADQAIAAAAEAAGSIRPGALYCDFNSVAPATKRRAAAVIEGAGAVYADVAVMAPVLPKRLSVPLLVSSPDVEEICARLQAVGFSPRPAGEAVGRASTIKMLRSVMVKGIEALTAECFLACARAGVADEVAASLDASWKEGGWLDRTDYNLDRMMVHGVRRAAEMEEVALTLADLDLPSDMAEAISASQRRIGALGLEAAEGFDLKAERLLGALAKRQREAA